MAKPLQVAGRSLRKEVHWHGIYWLGKPEALIASGLCAAEEMPGAPGQNKVSITFRETGRRIERQSKREFRLYMPNELILRRDGDNFRRFLAQVLEPIDGEGVH